MPMPLREIMSRFSTRVAWLVIGCCAAFAAAPGTTLAKQAVSKPKLRAIVFDKISTCIVGDPCTDANCATIARTDGSIVAQFEANDSFRGVRPSDAASMSPSAVCLHLELTKPERKAIEAALAGFTGTVRDLSSEMKLKAPVTRPGDVELSLSRYASGLWIAPWDAADSLPRAISPATDGVIAVGGTLDAAQGIVLPIAACGLTFGADFGLGGAGYSWVPYSNGYPFQCAGLETFFHEWLHQVDFAYENLMDVSDLYDGVYPACGLADPDPHRWFPSPDECTSDPDSVACGLTSCTIEFNSHVLATHYDFSLPYIGNHCRDGKLDYGESAIDVGGACEGRTKPRTRVAPMR